MKISLRVVPTQGQPRVVELAGKTLHIGRDPACELPIGDDRTQSVSRRHARIDEHDGAALLTDLRSTNGTFLNGVRVEGQLQIEVGDRIRLGIAGPTVEVLLLDTDQCTEPRHDSERLSAPLHQGQQPLGADRLSAEKSEVAPAAPQPLSFASVVQTPQFPSPGTAVVPPPQASPHSTREMLVAFMRDQDRRQRKTWATVGIVGLGLVLTVAAVGTWWALLPDEQQRRTSLVERIRRSVVQIEVGKGTGSGFVLNASGVIVSNHHVVNGEREATVIFADGTRSKVEGFLASVPGKDMVLLRVVPHRGFPAPLPLRQERCAPGSPVFAFGSPLGMRNSVTEGIVSRIVSGRELSNELQLPVQLPISISLYRDVFGLDDDAVWVQTDASVHPGNSGGPLVDLDGHVVGVNTFGHAEAMNFAVGAETLQQVVRSSGRSVRPLSELPLTPTIEQRLAEIAASHGLPLSP